MKLNILLKTKCQTYIEKRKNLQGNSQNKFDNIVKLFKNIENVKKNVTAIDRRVDCSGGNNLDSE